MVRQNRFGVFALWLACGGMLLPAPCVSKLNAEQLSVKPANYRTAKNVTMADVSLNRESRLVGRVLDTTGAGINDATVRLARDGQLVATAETDANGRFAIGPLNGGVYQVATASRAAWLRAWKNGTAPPAAVDMATLINGDIARGQGCTTPGCVTTGCGGDCGRGRIAGGPLGIFLHPLVIGAAVAAAIAIPLALDNDDDDAS